MKKILIPILAVILALFVVAMFLGRSNRSSSSSTQYHTHEDGSTHYSADVEPTYHVHDDGETHYEEH